MNKSEPLLEQVQPKKLIEEGHYSLILSKDEILTAVQILSFAQGMFEQMAENSHKDGDAKSEQTWSARAKLSLFLYGKLRDVANIGEPTSGEIH
jgi:hypothetical protein